MTQPRCGKPGRNVFITNLIKAKNSETFRLSFLRNNHNKTQIINALVLHFKSLDVRKDLQYKLIFTEEEKMWEISRNDIIELESSNHVEADTRIIMESLRSENHVVIKASDTDILILMSYAYCKSEKTSKWLMQIDSER